MVLAEEEEEEEEEEERKKGGRGEGRREIVPQNETKTFVLLLKQKQYSQGFTK